MNPTTSDEAFLNALLSPFVQAGNIMNKNHEEYYLNKTRTSEIMNQKIDVPSRLREALSLFGIREETKSGMAVFIEDSLGTEHIKDVFRDLERSCSDDERERIKAIPQDCEHFAELLTDVLFWALQENNISAPDTSVLWKHGPYKVDVLSGDLFRFGFNNRKQTKCIIVIPVNTAFDTHVSRKIEGSGYPLVSENTIHGQWLTRMQEAGATIEKIDARIEASLNSLGFAPIKTIESRFGGKTQCYPIGAISVIETNNAIYFLTAISEFDENNNARSSPDDIAQAVRSILTIYDKCGQGYNLYLPLIGTGRSRAGLSTKEAYDLLTKSLVENGDMIHGCIHLVIRPQDREEELK